MSYILDATPGTVVTIVLETLLNINNAHDGYRSDGYYAPFGVADGYGNDGYYNLPVVERIFMPSLSLASGYPKKMVKLDTGLYYFQFTLPTGASAVGTYIVDVQYIDPNTEYIAEVFYQVIVSAAYGQYSITTF